MRRVDGVVGGGRDLSQLQGDLSRDLKVEFTAFKSINVEALPVDNADQVSVDDLALGNADALSPFETNLASVLGPGVKEDAKTKFTNIGPSITYKLRDQAGQAREFHNYMLPINLDGGRYYLAGVRDTPADGFKYLRIPVDDQGMIDGFMRFRAALQQEALAALDTDDASGDGASLDYSSVAMSGACSDVVFEALAPWGAPVRGSEAVATSTLATYLHAHGDRLELGLHSVVLGDVVPHADQALRHDLDGLVLVVLRHFFHFHNKLLLLAL